MAVIEPRRDARLVPYAVVAVLGLGWALASGRVEAAALAAPFVAATVVGLRDLRPMPLRVELDVPVGTVLEGDHVEIAVRVRRPADARLGLRVHLGAGFEAVDPVSATAFVPPGADDVTVVFRVVAAQWGRNHIGSVTVRAERPGALVHHEVEAVGPPLRVLPRPLQLRALLEPRAAHASAGIHTHRRLVGPGSDFAEIREWQPGDRLRDLNWRATAARGTPHVNRQHPERSAEVVVVVDTFNDQPGDLSPVGRAALERCARAAWGVANLHLSAQDRVGFLAHGRVGMWLTPSGGDRARYQLLDALLELGGAVNAGSSKRSIDAARAVPPNALVVAFTPLWDWRIVDLLHRLRLAGRNVVAVVVDTTGLLGTPETAAAQSAQRLFALLLDERRGRLRDAGVPEVLWPADGDVSPAIARLRTLQRTRTAAGAGARGRP